MSFPTVRTVPPYPGLAVQQVLILKGQGELGPDEFRGPTQLCTLPSSHEENCRAV